MSRKKSSTKQVRCIITAMTFMMSAGMIPAQTVHASEGDNVSVNAEPASDNTGTITPPASGDATGAAVTGGATGTATGDAAGNATGVAVTGGATGTATGDAAGNATGEAVTGGATGTATGDAAGNATGEAVTGGATGDATGAVATGTATGNETGASATGGATGDATGAAIITTNNIVEIKDTETPLASNSGSTDAAAISTQEADTKVGAVLFARRAAVSTTAVATDNSAYTDDVLGEAAAATAYETALNNYIISTASNSATNNTNNGTGNSGTDTAESTFVAAMSNIATKTANLTSKVLTNINSWAANLSSSENHGMAVFAKKESGKVNNIATSDVNTGSYTQNLVTDDTNGSEDVTGLKYTDLLNSPRILLAQLASKYYDTKTKSCTSSWNNCANTGKDSSAVLATDTTSPIKNIYYNMVRDENGNFYLTGEYTIAADTTNLAQGNYLLGSSFKHVSDGCFHLDGYRVFVDGTDSDSLQASISQYVSGSDNEETLVNHMQNIVDSTSELYDANTVSIANAVLTQQYTQVYGQYKTNTNAATGKVTIDPSKDIATDNSRNYDEITGYEAANKIATASHPSSEFTANLVTGSTKNQNDNKVAISRKYIARFINAVISASCSKDEKGNYKSWSDIITCGENKGHGAGEDILSQVNEYWTLAGNAKDGYHLTGDHYDVLPAATDTDVDYFVGYVLKTESGTFHLDGYKVTVNAAQEEPTPNPTPNPDVPSEPTVPGDTTNNDVTVTPISTPVSNAQVLGVNRTAAAATTPIIETAVLGAQRASSEGEVLGAKRQGAETGDNNYAAGWVTLMTLSAGSAAAFVTMRHKKEDN